MGFLPTLNPGEVRRYPLASELVPGLVPVIHVGLLHCGGFTLRLRLDSDETVWAAHKLNRRGWPGIGRLFV